MQTLLSLTNTFDKAKKRAIFESITLENIHGDEDINQILNIFKHIHKKRLNSLFVEATGEFFDISEKEYIELHKYAEIAIDKIHEYRSYANISYEIIEEHLTNMFKKIN